MRVYVARMSSPTITSADVLRALQFLHWDELVPRSARVFIKPNLTWPKPVPGVTTSPAAIEALVTALRERTPHITIGESDGGYHSFEAEESLRGHGLYRLAERYGIRVLSLSKQAAESVKVGVAGRDVTVTLPRLLLRETDVFVTMPVPKVHVLTGVSLAFKNQWGCLPSSMRLLDHHQFDYSILAINRLLKPRLAIFDGSYFLNRTGPLSGEAVPMNLLIAGDDVGAASCVCCALMGIDPASVRHLRLARREGMFPTSLSDVELNAPLDPFLGQPFTIKRSLVDWLTLAGFRSALLTRLFWASSTAGPVHSVLYALRRNALIRRWLYGEDGPPPEWNGQASQP